MRNIPALKLNDVHLFFKGQRLPSFKSEETFTQPSFLGVKKNVVFPVT